jgi:hypothetical protein
MSAVDTTSGQRDFDHASYKALILLHNPVYKLSNVLAQILNFNIPALCGYYTVTALSTCRQRLAGIKLQLLNTENRPDHGRTGRKKLGRRKEICPTFRIVPELSKQIFRRIFPKLLSTGGGWRGVIKKNSY